MMSTTEKDTKNIHIFNRGDGETLIYFNYKASPINTDDFASLAEELYLDSGGRLVLTTDMSHHGILKLYENLAIKPTMIDRTYNGAINEIVGKIKAKEVCP